jgi:hypothetical protein
VILQPFNVSGLLEIRYDELIVKVWAFDEVLNQDHRIEIRVLLTEEASYLFENTPLPVGFAVIMFVAQISKGQKFQISIPYAIYPVTSKDDVVGDLFSILRDERVNTLIQAAIVKLADEIKMELVIGDYEWVVKFDAHLYPTVDVKDWLKPLYKS